MKDIPVYRFPAEHARENGELELYRASNKASAACKEAIEKAISEHYCDNVLHREAVAQVAEQFGHERILYVLAITIRQKDWDGRFSADNKQWAKTVPVSENPDAWGTDCLFPTRISPRMGEPRRMGDGSELLSGGEQPQRAG